MTSVDARPVTAGGLRLTYALVAVLGIGIDVVTKVLAVRHLDPQDPLRLLGGLLTLQLVRNPGAAFSTGEGFTYVFSTAAILVLAFVVVRLVPRIGHRGWAVALGLLTAGVGGNLVDRLFRTPGVMRGHVVDFLELPHWPIFNVADMCICAAAASIMILAVVKNVGIDGRRPGRDTETTEAETTEAGTTEANSADAKSDDA